MIFIKHVMNFNFHSLTDLIPEAPLFPMAEGMTSNEIEVSWVTPMDNEHLVTGYKVFYQMDGVTGFKSVRSFMVYFKRN